MYNPKKVMPLEELIPENTDKIICMFCGHRHFPEEKTFITFYGNVTVGLGGGLIGNNFNEDGTLGRLTFICRTTECINKLSTYLSEE